MKRLFTFIVTAILLTSFTTFSSIDEVVSGLKTGNIAAIVKFFDNTVELTMHNKTNNYSKVQAEMVLKDFFSNNVVKNFEVNHKGENAGSQYCIGKLVTKGGTFRATIFMKNKGDKQFLQELRFEVN